MFMVFIIYQNKYVNFHSDDYNRVLLKIDEGRSRDSDPDEEDEEESSDEEDEESTKYINASHIDVRYFTSDINLDARTKNTCVLFNAA